MKRTKTLYRTLAITTTAVCVSGANDALGRYTDKGGGGRSLSFWDMAAELDPWKDWKEVLQNYAEKASVAKSIH